MWFMTLLTKSMSLLMILVLERAVLIVWQLFRPMIVFYLIWVGFNLIGFFTEA